MKLVNENELGSLVDQISMEQPDVPKRGMFERLVKAFTVIGSFAKEAILDVKDLDFDYQDYVDIAIGKKEVTGRDFLKRYHSDDKEYDPSFIASLGTDIVTDPLTYIGFPLLGKATKVAKTLGATDRVAKYAGRAAAGGTLGLLGSDYTDDAGDVLTNVAAGAVLGPLAGEGLAITGKAIGKAGSKVVDTYAKATRSDAFDIVDDLATKYGGPKTTSEADELLKAKGTTLKQSKFFKEALVGKQKILKELLETTKLPEAEVRKLYTGKIAEAGGETVAMREGELQKLIKEQMDKVDTSLMTKPEVAALEKDITNDVFAQNISRLTREANTFVGDKVLKEIDSIGDEALSKAVRGYRDHNRKLVETYNKHHGTNQVPIDFHTADTIRDSKLPFEQQLDRELMEGFVKREKSTFDIEGLTAEDIDYISAQRYSAAFLDKQEKLARKILQIPNEIKAKIKGMPATSKALNTFEEGLRRYDAFTNGYLKPLHLLFTHSWLMNNYSDNVMKTWIEHGEMAALRTAGHSAPFNNLLKNKGSKQYKEMLDMFNPKTGHMKVQFDDELLDVATSLGVVDNNFYSGMMDTANDTLASIIAKKGRTKGQEYIEKLAEKNFLHKGADKFIDFLKAKIGTHGAAIEGAARLKAFEHQMGLLMNPKLKTLLKKDGWVKSMKNPEFAEVADKAKIFVNDVFFDYGNINVFEQKVMKRIAPYYTFFSRNLNYHMNALFDHTANMSKIFKIGQNIGDKPTEEERAGMPEWLLKYNPRVVDRDSLKGLKVNYIPNMSMIDAFEIISSPTESGRQKLNPILKMGYEQITNSDLFLKKTLGPEGYWRGRKPVFAGGLVPKMLGANIEENKSGSLYTEDSGTARILNVKSNVAPTPLLDTLVGIGHEVATGKRSVEEAIGHRGPLKNRWLSPKSMEWHRRNNE
ncbi:MAG: hypothetical protein U9O94_00485 [Nanoarchaeota archaeon]|nr:hypothetical protein [Nanoarchaeota archaeon]